MSSLDQRLAEAQAPSLEAILHASGITLPDQDRARHIMADARIGIATIAPWRRPAVRFLHANFGLCLSGSIGLIGIPFVLQAWSFFTLSCGLVGAFIWNARGYKRKQDWFAQSYESYVSYERKYVPTRAREIAEKIRTVKTRGTISTARLEVWTLAQDPVLVLRGVNECRYLAGWDGRIDLF